MWLLSSATFSVDRLQRGLGVRALAQKHAALDDVVVVDDLAVRPVNRLAHPAQPDLRALLDGRDIADPHGVPFWVLMTVLRMSSTFRTRPTTRTLTC